jgi:hypothetical protein
MDLIISDRSRSKNACPVERWWFPGGELGEKKKLARLAWHSDPALGT